MCVACDTEDGSSISDLAHQRHGLRPTHVGHDVVAQDQIKRLHTHRYSRGGRSPGGRGLPCARGRGRETSSDFLDGDLPVFRFVTCVLQGGEHTFEHGATHSGVLYNQHVTLLGSLVLGWETRGQVSWVTTSIG